MTVTGADADELDEVARAVAALGDRLRGSQRRLNGLIRAAPWQGRSAEAFRQQWGSTYRRSMVDAAGFLRQAGDDLRRQAAEQREASGAGAAGWAISSAPRRSPVEQLGGSSRWERWLDAGRRLWNSFESVVEGHEMLVLGAGLLTGLGSGQFRQIRSLKDAWGQLGAFDRYSRYSGVRLARTLGVQNKGVHGYLIRGSKLVGKVAPVISGISAAATGFDQYGRWRRGEVPGWQGILRTGWEATAVHPKMAAAHAGAWVGNRIAETDGWERNVTDSAHQALIRHHFGDDPTPSELAWLNQRYSGAGGIFRWGWDLGGNAIHGWSR